MLSKSDTKQVFDSKADEIDQTDEVHRKNGQLYLAMVASTDERSQVLVTGSASGRGVEAWEKARAAMGSRGCRAKSCTLQGNRCKLGLRAMIEKCESSVRKYEKDEKGEPLKLVGGLKMTAFESMLLYDLEDHPVLNRKKLNTFNATGGGNRRHHGCSDWGQRQRVGH